MSENKKPQEQTKPVGEAEAELPDELMDAAAGGGSTIRLRKQDPVTSTPAGNGMPVR